MSVFEDTLQSHTLGELRGLVKRMNVPNYIKIAGQPEKKVSKPQLINLIISHFELKKGDVVRTKELSSVLKGTPSKALGDKKAKKEAMNQIKKEADEAVKNNRGAKKKRLRDEYIKKAVAKLESGKRKVREDAKKPPPMTEKQKLDKEKGRVIIAQLASDGNDLGRDVIKPFTRHLSKTDGDTSIPMTPKATEKAIQTLQDNTNNYLQLAKNVNKMNKKDKFYGATIHELGIFGKELLETMGDIHTKELLGTKWGWKKNNTALTNALQKVHSIGEKISS